MKNKAVSEFWSPLFKPKFSGLIIGCSILITACLVCLDFATQGNSATESLTSTPPHNSEEVAHLRATSNEERPLQSFVSATVSHQ